MEKPTEDTEEQPQPDAPPAKSVGDVEAYESEWYEVLKRRSEELEAEGDDEGDGDEGDGDEG
jgi:hypothetical protein